MLENIFFSKKRHIHSKYSKCPKDPKVFITKYFAQKRSFSRESSSGNVECNFDNPVEKNPSTSNNFSLRSESHDEKSYYPIVFIKKVSFQKVSRKKISWHVKCIFVTLDKTTAPSLQINLGEKRKTPEKQVIL